MTAPRRRDSADPIVVFGDLLLDRDLDGPVERLAPDAPVPVVDGPRERARPGGAGLAAVLAAAARPVRLVTAIGDDDAGREARTLLAVAGVEVVDVGLDGATPQKVRVRAGGRPLARLDYGGRDGRPRAATPAATAAFDDAAVILVSDYGGGLTGDPRLRAAVETAGRRTPVVWDPHPRGATPVPGVRLATPNADEAARFVADSEVADWLGGESPATPADRWSPWTRTTARARILAGRWQAAGVAVTLGADGALFVGPDGTPLAVPAPPAVGDSCGAGDRFATSAAQALADGALPSEAVTAAVAAASAFVAAGGANAVRIDAGGPGDRDVIDLRTGDAPTQDAPTQDAHDLIAAVRARGGTVVATGGCFDLLHAGHVRLLADARALGDCLVVCLNSDDSVRRLKGPGRPLVPASDRAAVLAALSCVDAVAVFHESTPTALLERLRPDVWVKGADYAVADLPEAAVLSRWGGQAIVLPYLEGRSTTRIIQEAVSRDHA